LHQPKILNFGTCNDIARLSTPHHALESRPQNLLFSTFYGDVYILNKCEKSMRIIFSVLFTFALFAHSLICSATEANIFVLQSLRSPFDSSVLDKKYIDGLALQIGWSDVEPKAGEYAWNRVDQFVAEARRHKKKITLHLLPLHPPEWVFASGAEKFCFVMPARGDLMRSGAICEILPWDKVFLQRWSKLIEEFGKHYANDPAVYAVSLTAPTPEMVLPGGIPGTPAFFDLQRRYDKAVYLNAWKKMVDVYQIAFPDKPKILAPGIVLFDEYFSDDVVNYAKTRFGKKLWLFNAGLRADGIPQQTMGTGHIAQILKSYAKDGGVLGLQTIWSGTDDPRNRMRGKLRDALEKGVQMGASYFEIYAADVLNPYYQADLEKLDEMKY